MNQYKFSSRSSLSFAVHHNGRARYVNFSPSYRNQSYFITNDVTLAEKIRQHRWFKEGRISEEIVEIQPAKVTPAYQPSAPAEKKTYSILGRPMATNTPKPADTENEQNNDSNEQSDVAEEIINQKPEVANQFSVDSVTSFMEAKEFFVNNYGIARSECANRAMLEALCQHYNVQFPNYNP